LIKHAIFQQTLPFCNQRFESVLFDLLTFVEDFGQLYERFETKIANGFLKTKFWGSNLYVFVGVMKRSLPPFRKWLIRPASSSSFSSSGWRNDLYYAVEMYRLAFDREIQGDPDEYTMESNSLSPHRKEIFHFLQVANALDLKNTFMIFK
jgi:hypothetical protein